jgi:hypothetical protein
MCKRSDAHRRQQLKVQQNSSFIPHLFDCEIMYFAFLILSLKVYLPFVGATDGKTSLERKRMLIFVPIIAIFLIVVS